MDEIKNKINNKIKELYNRINQLNYSKKNIKFYYSEKIKDIKEEIKDLNAQYIYYSNVNQTNQIDLHGATRYFINFYIDDLIYEKIQNFETVIIITGKGSFVLFHHLKKHLILYNYPFTINNYIFTITK